MAFINFTFLNVKIVKEESQRAQIGLFSHNDLLRDGLALFNEAV